MAPNDQFFHLQNLSGHNAIVNCMAANADGVMVSGADNGTMFFWDWKTGYNFQRFQVKTDKDVETLKHLHSARPRSSPAPWTQRPVFSR